jgi:hypothetical protein
MASSGGENRKRRMKNNPERMLGRGFAAKRKNDIPTIRKQTRWIQEMMAASIIKAMHLAEKSAEEKGSIVF